MEADTSLLAAARKMNRNALVEIFDRYSPALYNYALHLCHDPLRADDIVADVFAKLLDQLSSGNGPSTNLRSYLYAITYHLVVDEARHSQRTAPLEVVDFLPRYGNSMFTSLENRFLFETIVLAVRNELTDDQRHVIILRFLEGFSLRETAKIIGKEVNYVKVIQNRGITRLRETLHTEVVS
jgi:RNA polymerase sigma-70 factor (ECF subfamily)